MIVLNLALKLAMFVLLGIFLIRVKVLDRAFSKQLSKFVMDVCLPCLILKTLWSETFEGDIGHLFLIVGLSIVLFLIMFLIGQLFYLALGRSDLGRAVRFSALFGNFSYVGIPVVEGLFGSSGLFIYTIYTLPLRLLYYASPVYLLDPNHKKGQETNWKEKIKPFLTPTTLIMPVGLFFYFTGLQMPAFFMSTVDSLAAICSPLGMIICGMGMSTICLSDLIVNFKAHTMTLMRNFISPAIALLFVLFLPIDSQIKHVIAIGSTIPVPSLLTVFTIQYGCSDEMCKFCSTEVFISTLLSVLTLPMWAFIIERVLG
ncbi:MAG: AEC family transporter [Oscillospiraceae bacterium]|jgi:predicted permease